MFTTNRTCSGIYSFLQASAARLSLSLRVDPASLEDTVVCADEHLLSQAVMRLIGNAIKFTAAGGRIYVRVTSRQRAVVRVDVTDSGVGMSVVSSLRTVDASGDE